MLVGVVWGGETFKLRSASLRRRQQGERFDGDVVNDDRIHFRARGDLELKHVARTGLKQEDDKARDLGVQHAGVRLNEFTVQQAANGHRAGDAGVRTVCAGRAKRANGAGLASATATQRQGVG